MVVGVTEGMLTRKEPKGRLTRGETFLHGSSLKVINDSHRFLTQAQDVRTTLVMQVDAKGQGQQTSPKKLCEPRIPTPQFIETRIALAGSLGFTQ